MDDIRRRGQLMFFATYFIIGFSYVATVVVYKMVFTWQFLLVFSFYLLSCGMVIVASHIKKLKGLFFEILTSVTISVMAMIIQVHWHGHYLMYILFMLEWIIGITFFRSLFCYINFAIQIASLTIMTYLAKYIVGYEVYNTRDFLISCMGMVLALWIVNNIVNILRDIYIEEEEQERSLDDMLAIVEVKHIEAREANKTKSLFLSKMSHEIRTPINTVLGMNEMIIRESNDTAIKGYAHNIKNAGNLLLSIINDILDSSKIESGKMELITADYNLAEVLGDLDNMISEKMKEKNLDFKIRVNPKLPSVYNGDDLKLHQILLNLLSNAQKYTVSGKVDLKVDGRVRNDVAMLTFTVSDTGIGIKKEAIASLTDEFVRLDETKTRNIEGTGLGISIVSNFLKMMGSRLEVQSEYGVGSVFSFTVTQRVVDKDPIGDIKSQINRKIELEEKSKKSFIAPDAHILVVDDNNLNLTVFKQLLKHTQMQIDTAISGNVAFSMAAKKKYDIIFMDHMMPGMDGIETLYAIRHTDEGMNKETPIVILTANAVSGAREMFEEAGFDAFLSKPIVPKKLEETVVKFLPEDMVMEESITVTERTDEAGMPDFSDYPMVDGLDYYVGWLHLKDTDLLIKTIQDMSKTMVSDANYLDENLSKINKGSEEALGLFRIKVHSMKSAANLVGLTPLAGSAALLEYAARDMKVKEIQKVAPFFIDEWKRYKKDIENAFLLKEGEKRLLADKSVLFESLDCLCNAVRIFDVDGSDSILEDIKSYSYSDEVSNLIELMSSAVIDFDYDTVNRLSNEIKEKMK